MRERPSPTWFELAGLGLMSALCVAAGTGGGYAISAATGSGVGVIFAGLAVGIVVAISATYFTIKRYL